MRTQAPKALCGSLNWQEDAELAGTLYRKSKPYTAYLIARCVEPGSGGPRTGEKSPVRPTMREFSEHAGIHHNTVAKYLNTWDALAVAGLVPLREELGPGVGVDVPDMKAWTYYYREANPLTCTLPNRYNSKVTETPFVTRVYKWGKKNGESLSDPTKTSRRLHAEQVG